MGGRLGARMEKAINKNEVRIHAMIDQTVGGEEDSLIIDDDELAIEDDGGSTKNKTTIA